MPQGRHRQSSAHHGVGSALLSTEHRAVIGRLRTDPAERALVAACVADRVGRSSSRRADSDMVRRTLELRGIESWEVQRWLREGEGRDLLAHWSEVAVDLLLEELGPATSLAFVSARIRSAENLSKFVCAQVEELRSAARSDAVQPGRG